MIQKPISLTLHRRSLKTKNQECQIFWISDHYTIVNFDQVTMKSF